MRRDHLDGRRADNCVPARTKEASGRYCCIAVRVFSYEVFNCRHHGSSQPRCGVTALTFGHALRLAIVPCFALSASQRAKAAEPAFQLLGKGMQIYNCVGAEHSFAWHLKAPEATLSDAHGVVVGHHFAGPTWQANDGSAIVGTVMQSSPSPDAGSIAWLVLNVKTHTGVGRFANVAFVVRGQTEGGLAPASGCDAAHIGGEARVKYQATYLFFPASR